MVRVNLSRLIKFIGVISNTPNQVSRRKKRLIEAYNSLDADTTDDVSIKLTADLERIRENGNTIWHLTFRTDRMRFLSTKSVGFLDHNNVMGQIALWVVEFRGSVEINFFSGSNNYRQETTQLGLGQWH